MNGGLCVIWIFVYGTRKMRKHLFVHIPHPAIHLRWLNGSETHTHTHFPHCLWIRGQVIHPNVSCRESHIKESSPDYAGMKMSALFITVKPEHYIKLRFLDVWTHWLFQLSYSALANMDYFLCAGCTGPVGYINRCLDICWGLAQRVGLSTWALENREIAQTLGCAVIKTSSRLLH